MLQTYTVSRRFKKTCGEGGEGDEVAMVLGADAGEVRVGEEGKEEVMVVKAAWEDVGVEVEAVVKAVVAEEVRVEVGARVMAMGEKEGGEALGMEEAREEGWALIEAKMGSKASLLYLMIPVHCLSLGRGSRSIPDPMRQSARRSHCRSRPSSSPGSSPLGPQSGGIATRRHSRCWRRAV